MAVGTGILVAMLLGWMSQNSIAEPIRRVDALMTAVAKDRISLFRELKGLREQDLDAHLTTKLALNYG